MDGKGIQASNAENTHKLRFRLAWHLQPPQRRQWGNQQNEIRQHVQACHDHPCEVDLDALRFDGNIPCCVDRATLEDRCEHHDPAIGRHEGPDCIKQDAEAAAWKDTREQKERTDFDRGDGRGIEDFCGEYAL